jgi:hypothetical protein
MTNQENIVRTFLTNNLPSPWVISSIETIPDGRLAAFVKAPAPGFSPSGEIVFVTSFDPESTEGYIFRELKGVVELLARMIPRMGYSTIGAVVSINPARNEIAVTVPASVINRAGIMDRVILAHTLDLAEPV